MPYFLIVILVGLAIIFLTLTITEGYTWFKQVQRRRAADRIWEESDR